MEKFILGKKLGMTQVFTEEGLAIPVTAVLAGPITVLQIKTKEQDGYCAIKVGFAEKKESATNKPMKGMFEKANVTPKKVIKEFRVEDVTAFEVGKEYNVADIFEPGNIIDVTGTSKGKGFAGTVKRHGTATGPKTHGSHYHRGPGSLGGASSPSKVFKGKKLPGHMGHEKVTVQNLEVVKVYSDKNLLLIKGAVPGPKNGMVIIKQAVKV